MHSINMNTHTPFPPQLITDSRRGGAGAPWGTSRLLFAHCGLLAGQSDASPRPKPSQIFASILIQMNELQS